MHKPTWTGIMTTQKPDQLHLGESLNVGDSLTSQDGRFMLFLENDGGLRLYGYRVDNGRQLSWQMPPNQFAANPNPNASFHFDQSGLYVQYATPVATTVASSLHSFSGGQDLSNVFLVVQSDGNLVLYAAGGPQLVVLWASGTDLHSITTTPSRYIAPRRPIVEFAAPGVVAVTGGGVLQNKTGVDIGARDNNTYVAIAIGGSVPIAQVGTVTVSLNTYNPPLTGQAPDSNTGLSADATPESYQLQHVGYVLEVTPAIQLSLSGN
jgi:hypothetical protein